MGGGGGDPCFPVSKMDAFQVRPVRRYFNGTVATLSLSYRGQTTITIVTRGGFTAALHVAQFFALDSLV